MRDELFRRQSQESFVDTGFGKTINLTTPGMVLISTVLLLIAVIIGLYLYFGQYTRTEIVAGVLVPKSGQSVIRASAGGVVREINIKLGQQISAGETIARIERPRYSSELGTNTQLQTRNIAQRLDALVQRVTFTETQQLLERTQIKNRINRLVTREAELNARIDLNARTRALSKERLERATQNRQRQLNTVDEVDSARLDHLAQIDEQLQLNAELNSLRAERRELEVELELLLVTHRIQIKELKELELDYEAQLQELNAESVTLIKAPVSGYVSVDPPELGQLLKTNDMITILRPSLNDLEATIYVPPDAIGFIKVGQNVRLKYDAFPYQRFGSGIGQVAAIGSAALPALDLNAPFAFPQGATVYPVTVELEDSMITSQGVPIRLRPDMTLRADIVLDRIRIHEWLLDPLYRLRARLLTP